MSSANSSALSNTNQPKKISFTVGGIMMGTNKGQYRDIGKEIAKELKAEDFGSPEEIAEKAKPIRMAKSRAEAKPILEEIASKGALKSADGIEATISGKSKREILCGKASHNSFEQEAHWQAVANIDKFYGNAIEIQPVGLDPYKDNRNLESRKFLYSPMEYHERIVPVKFAILEYKRDGNLRLYSIEALDVELGQKNRGCWTIRAGKAQRISGHLRKFTLLYKYISSL